MVHHALLRPRRPQAVHNAQTIADREKGRLRNIKMLREILTGAHPKDVASKYHISLGGVIYGCRQVLREIAYRSIDYDREKHPTNWQGPTTWVQDAIFWLPRLKWLEDEQHELEKDAQQHAGSSLPKAA